MHVAGCSVDTVDAQQSFADKLGGIRFPLLADPEGRIARGYDVYRDDWKTAGRATVVIGEDGTVLLTYPRAPLDGKGHAEAVFADVANLFR